MKDRLRELSRQAYCDYVEQLKRPVCLGVDAKLKDGTFGKAELEGHIRAAELLGRHRALAEAAALASQPSDLKAKLESLRDEMDSIARRHHASVKALAKQTSAKLTAIIEGKD